MMKLLRSTKLLRRALIGLLALAAVSLVQPNAASAQVVVLSDQTKHAGEFVIPLNKSQVLRLDVALTDLLVGNPEIADVLALTDKSIYVLGKSVGSTSLTLYGQDKELIAVLDLIVSLDADGLKARLHEMLPNERVEVRQVNGALVLSGTVSSAPVLSKVLAIAGRYAPEGGLTNLMNVAGSQQVMLEVKFVEMSRTKAKAFGFNTNLFDRDFQFRSGDSFLNPGSSFTPDGDLATALLDPTTFGAAVAPNITLAGVGIDLLVETLESKGVLKTIAEPNLIALSGDTASFLAGGEFPVVVETEDTTDVEFKEFGISLSFTPTVLEDGLMNIIVSPEVSQLDPTASVFGGLGQVQAFGLSTRRATTTVELRDGQSFAIAGLIQSTFQDNIDQVPGLGDIPVLGTLFRSSDFQRNETELVIIITPHLVRPAPAGSLATPADNFVPPSDAELFLFGQIEGPRSGYGRGTSGHSASADRGSQVDHTLSAQSAGGIDGSYGHIVK